MISGVDRVERGRGRAGKVVDVSGGGHVREAGFSALSVVTAPVSGLMRRFSPVSLTILAGGRARD